MTIKSLLLGSAAVLVAVSGARAADAIVVEPEPVEYVRVCDAYGSGWFYIPGTETCLKFDGEVRGEYRAYHYHEDLEDETSAHRANYRARLNVRARNETEYGPLDSRIRFQASGTAGTGTGTDAGKNGHNDQISQNEGPGSAATVVNIAVISLAGFRVGYQDDYWTTAGGYGFYEAAFDGVYQYNTALFVDYTYAANGFAATIGASDGDRSGEAGAPDIYGGLTYSSGGFYAAGIYYYDGSEEAGAWKVRLDYDFGNGWRFGGGYLADDGDTDYVKGHAWFVTSAWQFTDTMELYAGYGYYDDGFDDAAVLGTNCVTTACDLSQHYTTVGLVWDIVPGLVIQPEYHWSTYSGDNDGLESPENFGAFNLRVIRSF